MALIVEDGTGLPNANSYVSVATADAYFAMSGQTAWTCPDTAKEIVRLTLTDGASGDGNVTVTLNSVVFTVAVTIGSATQVCGELRAATYAGWVTGGVDGYVTFTAATAGCRSGTYAFGAGTTGAVGSFTETQTGSDAAKEQALVRATRAIDGMYASRWPGTKLISNQALDWPRGDAVDIDGYALQGIPNSIGYATCEAALVEIASAGSLSKAQARGGKVRRERIEGAVDIEYADNAPSGTTYTAIDQALSRILSSSGLTLRRG